MFFRPRNLAKKKTNFAALPIISLPIFLFLLSYFSASFSVRFSYFLPLLFVFQRNLIENQYRYNSPILTVPKVKMKTLNYSQLFLKILSFRFFSRRETENIASNLSFSRLNWELLCFNCKLGLASYLRYTQQNENTPKTRFFPIFFLFSYEVIVAKWVKK